MKTKVYIAGPMRGIKNFNREAFNLAEQDLRARGYDVYNPVTADIEAGIDPTSETGNCLDIPDFDQAMFRGIVKRCIDAILQCDAIYLLHGYQHSMGARGELAVADWLGLAVMYESVEKYKRSLANQRSLMVNPNSVLRVGDSWTIEDDLAGGE